MRSRSAASSRAWSYSTGLSFAKRAISSSACVGLHRPIYAAVWRAVENCPSRITFNKPISVLRSSCNPLDVNVNGRCASDGNIGQFGLHAITDSLPNAADRIHAGVLSDLLDFLQFLGWANWKELSPLFDGKDWVWTNAPPRVVMCWRPSNRPGPVPRVDKLWSRY
jgi:hypothetical protein